MSTMSINKNKGLINTGKFTLWMFLVSIVMIFASLTSAYIVRRAEGNWLEFELPNLFIWSSFIILFSSLTLHLSYLFIKKDNIKFAKLLISITLFLGFAFLLTQWYAWGELVNMKVFFGGSSANAAGSFMYVITGVHAAHIISAIIYLLIIFTKTLRNKISSSNAVVLQTCATYWHFLGILWIYLYIFLILNH